jgi:hypothetical protein
MRAGGFALGFLVVLSACGSSEEKTAPQTDASRSLDEQAIAKGLLPNPEGRALAGRYETRSELGTDKFCAVGDDGEFTIGMLAVFGPDSKCEAQGRAEFVGEKVRITLSGKKSCSFEAEFDGIQLRFPGTVPEGCASYCSPRASMSGTSYFFTEPGNASARATLGRDIERLCR